MGVLPTETVYFTVVCYLFRVPFNLPELNFLVGFYSFHMRKVDKYTYVCQPNLPNLDFDQLWLACFLSNPCQCKKCCQTWKLEINLVAFCFCHWAYNGAAISHLCLLDPIELCFCCIFLIVIIASIFLSKFGLKDHFKKIQTISLTLSEWKYYHCMKLKRSLFPKSRM